MYRAEGQRPLKSSLNHGLCNQQLKVEASGSSTRQQPPKLTSSFFGKEPMLTLFYSHIWKGIHTLVPSSVCHCLWKRQFSTNYQSQLVQGGEVADEKRTVSFQPMPYVGVLTRSLLDPYTPHGSDCLRMNSSDIHLLKSSHNAN